MLPAYRGSPSRKRCAAPRYALTSSKPHSFQMSTTRISMVANSRPIRKRSIPRWIFFVAATLLFALMCYALSTYALSREVGADVAAYWEAAERIRAGEPLYVAGAANASDLYRYAPRVAYVWGPLTFLPRA